MQSLQSLRMVHVVGAAQSNHEVRWWFDYRFVLFQRIRRRTEGVMIPTFPAFDSYHCMTCMSWEENARVPRLWAGYAKGPYVSLRILTSSSGDKEQFAPMSIRPPRDLIIKHHGPTLQTL